MTNNVERPPARGQFRSSREAEARLLLLIDRFSRNPNGTARVLEGRVKLAKLDFLLRYPRHLDRVLQSRGASKRSLQRLRESATDDAPLDARMVRFRYGPWDPSYYAVLGSLIGRGLVEVLPLERNGFGYRTTPRGAEVAAGMTQDDTFDAVNVRLELLLRHLDVNGSRLRELVYTLPEVAHASWRQELR